jgi:hypothetical protein
VYGYLGSWSSIYSGALGAVSVSCNAVNKFKAVNFTDIYCRFINFQGDGLN